MADCIFCQIANGDTATKFIYEDDYIVVFADIHPKAKTHLLVTPKEHIQNLMQTTEKDTKLLTHMMIMLPKLAKELGLTGFRTIINTGAEGGQEIDHLHFHLLAGNLPKF